MSTHNEERQRIGRIGEDAATQFLEERGFEIVDRNVRVGRLEIDIIAERNGLLVFCEVRTKKAGAHYAPAESIDYKKIQRLRRAAIGWLQQQSPPRRARIRLDAAAVTLNDNAPPQIEYYENIEMR